MLLAPLLGLAGSAGQQLAGFFGQQSQVNAANAAARRNYELQIAQYKNDWDQRRNTYRQQLVDYKKNTQAYSQAAWAGYTQEQTRLNEIYKSTVFNNQELLSKLVKTQGARQASGQVGKTAARLQAMDLAGYGREQAATAESLVSARTQFGQTTEQIRRQQEAAQNRAYSSVSMAPVAGFAPLPPTMRTGPSVLGLAAGLAGSFATASMQNSALLAPKGYTGIPGSGSTNNFGLGSIGSLGSSAFSGLTLPNFGSYNIPGETNLLTQGLGALNSPSIFKNP